MPSLFSETLNTSLPAYTPSSPAPSYSLTPANDEHRLAHTPQRARRIPLGVFTKSSGSITLVLENQEPNTPCPSYGRQAAIRGSVILERSKGVSEVVVELGGRLYLTIPEGGGRTEKILNASYSLWSRQSQNDDTCPGTIPFSFLLPATFASGDTMRPLPPSAEVAFPGANGVFVIISYVLTVLVKKTRRSVAFWSRSKTLALRFNHYPRTAPNRPVLQNTFVSTLKTAAEEWHQAISIMKTRPSSNFAPIHCLFFVPSVKIFGLSDTIPFHIQLVAPLSSLREFLPPIDTAESAKSKRPTKPVIRVHLLRQVCVMVRNQTAWRNAVIGEGKLWPLPPSQMTSPPVSDTSSQEESLDWEGEVRCGETVTTGGFNAGNVSVKDFIVLDLVPPDPEKSPLMSMQYALPIRLVTDSWIGGIDP